MCMRLVLAWCSARPENKDQDGLSLSQVVLAQRQEETHLKWGLENVIKKSRYYKGWEWGTVIVQQ